MSSDLLSRSSAVTVRRWLTFFVLLYVFLVAIQLFSGSMKYFGGGTDLVGNRFAWLSNPFAGLAVGVLCTVLVQSSSVTTSTIVALVSAGNIPVGVAIPMVMGANIGTSITNTLVS